MSSLKWIKHKSIAYPMDQIAKVQMECDPSSRTKMLADICITISFKTSDSPRFVVISQIDTDEIANTFKKSCDSMLFTFAAAISTFLRNDTYIIFECQKYLDDIVEEFYGKQPGSCTDVSIN